MRYESLMEPICLRLACLLSHNQLNKWISI